LLAFSFAFAAGAMLALVVELVPQASNVRRCRSAWPARSAAGC
jgi:zinc transporter ZupT